jgi:hypothetical protein
VRRAISETERFSTPYNRLINAHVSEFMRVLWHGTGSGSYSGLFCGQLFPDQDINQVVYPTILRGLFCGQIGLILADTVKLVDGHLAYRGLFCGQIETFAGQNPSAAIRADVFGMGCSILFPVISCGRPCPNFSSAIRRVIRMSGSPVPAFLPPPFFSAARMSAGFLEPRCPRIRRVPPAAKPASLLFDLHGAFLPEHTEATLPLSVAAKKICR